MELFFTQLHFLRPFWFFSFIPLILFVFLLITSHKTSRSWQTIIDPKLLPHLLVGKQSKHSTLPSILYFIVGTLIIVSLAGPAWEKRPQPVFKEQSALIIALDLSRSMDAGDIKPSRLTRARHKITDILKQRKLGQTALIVYAADAYTVSPLTDDTATITSLLSSLTTDIMPSQGTRTDKALKTATTLFENAGVKKGDILLVTDGVESNATTAFKATSKNHRISILAVASHDGAPIPQPNGGFFKDRRGNIVVPKLNMKSFKKFMNIGSGHLSVITTDDSDILHISSLFNTNRFDAKKDSKESTLQTDSWYEQGPWLLLIVIPLVALTFRRGVLLVIAFIMLQQPQYAEAASLWDSLWSNDNQRAARLLEQDKPAEAAELFNNNEWQAASHYKNNEFQKSIDALQDTKTADGHYNKGNAYAKLGDNQKAIKAYDEALKLNPQHKDAIYNKELIIKKQNEQKKEQQNNKNSGDQDSSDKDKNQSKDGKPDKGNSSPDNDKQTGNQDDKDQSGQSNNNKDSKDPKDKESSKESDKDSDEKSDPNKSDQGKDAKSASKLSDEQAQETDKATQQWLRRIPDDPGGLLRNKFKYQYKRQQRSSEDKNW